MINNRKTASDIPKDQKSSKVSKMFQEIFFKSFFDKTKALKCNSRSKYAPNCLENARRKRYRIHLNSKGIYSQLGRENETPKMT